MSRVFEYGWSVRVYFAVVIGKVCFLVLMAAANPAGFRVPTSPEKS